MGKFNLSDWLKGKKTYIMSAALVCYSLGGMVAGKVEPNIGIPIILSALGLGSLRLGVEKSKTAVVQS